MEIIEFQVVHSFETLPIFVAVRTSTNKTSEWRAMTTNFMPTDTGRAEALEERLSKTIFRSVSDFLSFYNSGLINRKFDEVKDLAQEITETFKNVKEKSNNLVFISQEEVYLDELLAGLKPWEIIVKAKREVKDAIVEGKIENESLLVLTESGTLSIVKDDGKIESLGGEKLFNKNDTIGPLLAISSYGTDFSSEHDGFLFQASDLAELDTTFIHRLKENMPA